MSTINNYIKETGIVNKRHKSICEQIIKTTSYEDAAKKFGISRQRAYQVWKKYFEETPKEVVVKIINNK